ncbi:MAG: hypothetical protein A2Y33_00770 [Spirochaetes bacterium GWF1_51_8]|nr:MAG: hypothetical protein A2Y33_00770 [Spirochaetes bacterium GWF1_51_8]
MPEPENKQNNVKINLPKDDSILQYSIAVIVNHSLEGVRHRFRLKCFLKKNGENIFLLNYYVKRCETVYKSSAVKNEVTKI